MHISDVVSLAGTLPPMNGLLVFRSKVLPVPPCRLLHVGSQCCSVIPAAPCNKEKAGLASSSCPTSCCPPPVQKQTGVTDSRRTAKNS